MKRFFFCGLFAFVALGAALPEARPALDSLPAIDGWLLYDNGSCANWLGKKYKGQFLKEPINVIIVDKFASSQEEAISKIMRECKKADYEEEYGHSSGYAGLIDGVMYHQIPNEKRMAFANHDFFMTNNHGRIIGPAPCGDRFVFIAAFSREQPSVVKGFHHSFVSFKTARDGFCASMEKKSLYKNAGTVFLGNTVNDDKSTTADHDGYATVLVATE